MALEVVYLVRHGKAEGSHPQGDSHRSLSGEGRARIAHLLPQAVARNMGCDLALASPYLRAVQTRDLFGPALGSARRELSSFLVPDGDPDEAVDELVRWEEQGFRRIAIFTHNPFVTRLATLLLKPVSGPEPVFHTPTILAVGFEGPVAAGTGSALWTLHP